MSFQKHSKMTEKKWESSEEFEQLCWRKYQMRAWSDYFFQKKQFIPVQTPILSPYYIPESSIHLFSTHHIHPAHDGQDPIKKRLYLLPSPELYMKILLSHYQKNLYQIGPCFRNQEFDSPEHQNEFMMLEFYKINTSLWESAQILEEFIQSMIGNIIKKIKQKDKIWQKVIDQQSHPDQFLNRWTKITQNPFLRISLSELFLEHLHFDFVHYPDEKSLLAQAQKIFQKDKQKRTHLEFLNQCQTWEEIFHYLFVQFIQEHIPHDPVFIYGYPQQVATTAALDPLGHTYQRYELYINQMELANAYEEAHDSHTAMDYLEQQKKLYPQWEKDSSFHFFEKQYTEIIEQLPPCSGVALGYSRLEMILTACSDIEHVFPIV